MSKVVAVHGVGKQFEGPEVLEAIWLPPMLDGLHKAGYSRINDFSLTCAFYGDLFGGTGKSLKSKKGPPVGVGRDLSIFRKVESRRPQYQHNHTTDQTTNLEQDLLKAWYQHSAELDPGKSKRVAQEKPPSRSFLVGIYDRMFASRFMTAISEQALLGDARQIGMYMQNQDLRVAARERIVEAIRSDTRVIVGHSLGAVVAYETLCLYPKLPVMAFVTLGSPLGIRNLIFDRLEPAPETNVGKWPDGIQFWHNVVDPNDIVAVGKALRSLFDPRVDDHFVDNGNEPHSLTRYLSKPETGQSIFSGLQE